MYRGRFAPSPTGPLHFGSLVAAVASWLDARAGHGEWLVRIEDVDAARTVPGAADAILRTLDAFGLEWDGEVLYQSRRTERYREALDRLRNSGWVFGCRCSRREIADSALGRDGGRRYPGTCRGGLQGGTTPRAWRVKVDPGVIRFEDRLRGSQRQDVEREVGDFVLMRADGFFAYQLAVVIDDADQGMTHIVRGADLLDSTARQIYLQRLLGLPQPAYLHLPVAVSAAGEKLSKQTRAPPVEPDQAYHTLPSALAFLGYEVPTEIRGGGVAELLDWAWQHWSVKRLPADRAMCAPAALR